MTWDGKRLFAATLVALVAACGSDGKNGAAGSAGANGANGSDGSAYGTLSGTIGDTYGNKVAGATASFVVGTDTVRATSDANGAYELSLPPGPRSVSFAATGYGSYSQSVEVAPSKTATLNVRLNPTGPAAVTAARTDTVSPVVPGLTVGLEAKAFVFDPALAAAAKTYKWTVVSGPAVTFDDDTSATPKATLASSAKFKKHLAELAAPRYKVNPDEPPVNVDRYQVLPISYEQALSQGNTTKLKVTVTVGGKQYAATTSIAATIPAVPSSGLHNVPVNAPVVLQGQFPFKNADGSYVFPQKATWSWSVAGPDGQPVAVNDAATPYPDFTPTAVGKYVVSEGGLPRFELYAGRYTGAVLSSGEVDPDCTVCHRDGGVAPDKFSSWQKTGHKAVMYAGIMEPLPDGHYSKSCTPCHTVGAGQAGSGGFADKLLAEQIDFSILQGNLNVPSSFAALYPQSTKLAGIQCENCHGPHEGTRHASSFGSSEVVGARFSFSANVCATCHGRAPKHGRFPQWQNSGHASFATFTFNSGADGSLSAGCAACHSAQGFKAYRKALPAANGNRNATVLPVGLSLANAQPITCATCHDSHDEGEASQAEWSNLSKVGPSEGSTYMLPGGFAATGVGKGALCIACHNSRNGYAAAFDGNPAGGYLHEDGDAKFGTLTSYSAPHEAAQGDVLLGRNAYWLGTALYNSPQTRSKHSYITDTCVTCHMELTTLDPALSEAGQTRHDFKATPDVCNKCHTAYSTESVQAVFDERLVALKSAVGKAILRLKYADAIPAGTTAALVANRSGQVDVTSGGVTRRWFIGDKSGQDAFLSDPNAAGATVQGCTMVDEISANCDGFLKNAPGVAGLTSAQDGTVTASGVNGIVAKALWNTVLVQDDASRGVHNPAFAMRVIDATLEHVSAFTK